MAGNGAYSSHAEITDAERLMRMAFRVNWKASFDFPYMGMFLPPVKTDADEWIDFKKQKTCMAKMRDSARNLRRMGFYELNYFNVTECGAYDQYPPAAAKAADDADLWKDANDFLFYRAGQGDSARGRWQAYRLLGRLRGNGSWREGLSGLSRGTSKRHIERIPESFGICIDRMDWIHFYNRQRDDGVTWFEDKPARSLVNSWHEVNEPHRPADA